MICFGNLVGERRVYLPRCQRNAHIVCFVQFAGWMETQNALAQLFQIWAQLRRLRMRWQKQAQALRAWELVRRWQRNALIEEGERWHRERPGVCMRECLGEWRFQTFPPPLMTPSSSGSSGF